ncbi:MAG: ATP-binding cassette domain-containing protein [Armatimonas sp.]
MRSLTVAGSSRPELDSVHFSVAPGEIFGVAGVDGNGQDALSECLTGLKRPASGQILIDGSAPAPNPAAFHRAGVTSVPADRQRQGLALPLSLTENLTLGVHNDSRFRKGPLLNWPKLRERTRTAITRFDIRAEGPEAAANSLSGGNQQKVVLARALADSPRVVVAVNPTRGLDVGAIAFVHDALRKARDAGAAIVLISTELDEIQALSDRVGVLYEGRLTVAQDSSRATLGRLMGGAT